MLALVALMIVAAIAFVIFRSLGIAVIVFSIYYLVKKEQEKNEPKKD